MITNDLIEVFGLDIGSRPGIYFEGLQGYEVARLYRYLAKYCEPLSDYFTVWNSVASKDVSINSISDPIGDLLVGKIDQFCHPISGFSHGVINVNNVSVFVAQDSIELFYDVRDIDSEIDIENILRLVTNLVSFTKNCVPFFGDECGSPQDDIYQAALVEYLNITKPSIGLPNL